MPEALAAEEIPIALIFARSASSRSPGSRYSTTLVASSSSAVRPSDVSVGSAMISFPMCVTDATCTNRGIVKPCMFCALGSSPFAHRRFSSTACVSCQTTRRYVLNIGCSVPTINGLIKAPQPRQRHCCSFHRRKSEKSGHDGRDAPQQLSNPGYAVPQYKDEIENLVATDGFIVTLAT